MYTRQERRRTNAVMEEDQDEFVADLNYKYVSARRCPRMTRMIGRSCGELKSLSQERPHPVEEPGPCRRPQSPVARAWGLTHGRKPPVNTTVPCAANTPTIRHTTSLSTSETTPHKLCSTSRSLVVVTTGEAEQAVRERSRTRHHIQDHLNHTEWAGNTIKTGNCVDQICSPNAVITERCTLDTLYWSVDLQSYSQSGHRE